MAWLARDLVANRQNVQRIVNDLEKEGLVVSEPNPHHKRAQLVVLTALGKRAYERAVEVWYSAADELAKELPQEELAASVRVLRTLCGKLTLINAGEDETVE